MRVLIVGDWSANILTLGDATLHVGKEAMAVAQDAAYALVAEGVPPPVGFDAPTLIEPAPRAIIPEFVEGPSFTWADDDIHVDLAFVLKMGPRTAPYRARHRVSRDLTAVGAGALYEAMWTRATEWLRGERVPEDFIKGITVTRPEPPLVAKARERAEALAAPPAPESLTPSESSSATEPALLETPQA